MTAGIAASRPMAVASSASAIPGATTARLVDFEPAIAWNEVMIPTTVPNRPTNGPAEPIVASEAEPRLRAAPVSRDSVTGPSPGRCASAGRSAIARPLEALLPFAHGSHEDRAHACRLPVGRACGRVLRATGPTRRSARSGRAGAAHARECDQLVDDDRPRPDRGREQADHDELDHPACLDEEVPHGQLNAGLGESEIFHRRSLRFPGVARGWPVCACFPSIRPRDASGNAPKCANPGLFGANIGERKARPIGSILTDFFMDRYG